jgi:glycosyltransferase involved in cell wall biosynthesis
MAAIRHAITSRDPMKVSVIIPSRLARNPSGSGLNLFLDLSAGGVLRQTIEQPIEIVVGLDHGAKKKIPQRFLEQGRVPILFAESRGKGQAAAVNAAVRKATGDVLAFCEDDDLWEPSKLAVQVPLLDQFDLVTCNQRERDHWGAFVATTILRTLGGSEARDVGAGGAGGIGARLGGCSAGSWWFDEASVPHGHRVAGRANALGLKRAHLIQDGYTGGNWLHQVAQRSKVLKVNGLSEPLVHRFVNPDGGMGQIAAGGEARERSRKEHEIMVSRFGGQVPW